MKILTVALLILCFQAPVLAEVNPEYDQHLKYLASQIPAWRLEIQKMDIPALGVGYAQRKVIEDSRNSMLEDLKGIEGCIVLVQGKNHISDQIGLVVLLATATFMAKTLSDNFRIFSGPQGEEIDKPWRTQLGGIIKTLGEEEYFQVTAVGDRADALEASTKP